MRLPSASRSRAVFIGTGTYRSDGLPDVPEVVRNVADLNATLTDPATGVLLGRNCRALLDETTSNVVGHALLTAARAAEDLLLVYYSGHGLLSSRRHELHLALSETDPDTPGFSAIHIDVLREAMLESRAENKVLILDCCYSGRATAAALADPKNTVLSQIEVAGTYTMAAAPANRTAVVLPGEPHTAFTGRLLEQLRPAMGSEPAESQLGEIYWRLRSVMTAEGLPRPEQCGTGTADQLILARPGGVPPADLRPDAPVRVKPKGAGDRVPFSPRDDRSGSGARRKYKEAALFSAEPVRAPLEPRPDLFKPAEEIDRSFLAQFDRFLAQQPGNAAYSWDAFDPAGYAGANYDHPAEVDRRVLRLVAEHFIDHGLVSGNGVDVGTGSNLYPVLAMLPFCVQVTLIEPGRSNRDRLIAQLPDYDEVWDQYWDRLVATGSAYFDTRSRKAFAERVQVRDGNVLALPARTWDIGTMFFVAESISTRRSQFARAVQQFIAALRPGAPFAAGFMSDSSGYHVGRHHFPAVPVSKDDVRQCLARYVDDVKVELISPDTVLREGDAGVILALGRTNDH